jgi:hypothetical protein
MGERVQAVMLRRLSRHRDWSSVEFQPTPRPIGTGPLDRAHGGSGRDPLRERMDVPISDRERDLEDRDFVGVEGRSHSIWYRTCSG